MAGGAEIKVSGGNGGGGKNKKPRKNWTQYKNMPVVSNMQPFMGNNQALLANQLNAGFGGGVDPYNAQMDEVYHPMKSVGLFEPLTETAAALKKGKYRTKGSTGLISLDRVLKGNAGVGVDGGGNGGMGGASGAGAGGGGDISAKKQRPLPKQWQKVVKGWG